MGEAVASPGPYRRQFRPVDQLDVEPGISEKVRIG
jgi:hypothetical protein